MTPKQTELLPCKINAHGHHRWWHKEDGTAQCLACDSLLTKEQVIKFWPPRPADTSQTMLEEGRQQWENIPENFHSEFVIGLWFGEFSSDRVKLSYCDINGDWWTFENESGLPEDIRVIRQVRRPLKIQFLPSPERTASLPSSVPCECDRVIEEAKHVMKNASAFLIQLSITLKDGDYKALSLKHADILKAALSKLTEEAARAADIARALEPLVSYKKRDDASFWGDAFYRTIKVSTEDLDLAERVYRAIKSSPSEARVKND